jgi:hypothetical protein
MAFRPVVSGFVKPPRRRLILAIGAVIVAASVI